MIITFISILNFECFYITICLNHLFREFSTGVAFECVTGMSHAHDVSGMCMSPTLGPDDL